MSIRSRIALKALESLDAGKLDLVFPNGNRKQFVGKTRTDSLTAEIVIHDLHAIDLAVSRGDIGFGEGYMQGLWSTPNLSALLGLFAANRESMEKLIYGQWWATLWDQLRHLMRSNRKSQAKKNISAHYDLGNEFYRLFLDPTMTYSSALFDTQAQAGAMDLEAGQCRKIDRALEQLRIDPADPEARFLEIGCGWGGLANRLLDRTAGRYVGLTLSVEQQKWAREVLAPHGQDRVDIRLQDYRDIHEQFDGIVSIEMFEAVGEGYWDAYFKAVAHNLKPSGRAVIQTITIDEGLFDRYRKSTDFIQQYIFPGGMLPSSSEFERRAAGQGLAVEDAFYFGQDYAKTLAMWEKTFLGKQTVVQSQGFSPEFCRMWQFYLSYCEAGFSEKNINVAQFTLHKTT